MDPLTDRAKETWQERQTREYHHHIFKMLEWCDNSDGEYHSCCQICGAVKDRTDHQPNCILARVIRETAP